MKTYDLNIFFADLGYNEETDQNEWETRLTIVAYVYQNDAGVSKTEVATFYTTEEESVAIRKHFPEEEYGDDWWEFIDNFLPVAPARIASLLKTLPAPEDAPMDGETLVLSYGEEN